MDKEIPPADSFYEPGDTIADPAGDILPVVIEPKKIDPDTRIAWTADVPEHKPLPEGSVRIQFHMLITNSEGKEIFNSDDYNQVSRGVDYSGTDNRSEKLLLGQLNSLLFEPCREAVLKYAMTRIEEDKEQEPAPVMAPNLGLASLPPIQPVAPLMPNIELDDESEEDKEGKA